MSSSSRNATILGAACLMFLFVAAFFRNTLNGETQLRQPQRRLMVDPKTVTQKDSAEKHHHGHQHHHIHSNQEHHMLAAEPELVEPFDVVQEQRPLPICLTGRTFGRAFNMMIQLTNIMHKRSSPNQQIGIVNEAIAMWFDQNIEPNPMFIPHFKGDCEQRLEPIQVHFTRPGYANRPEYGEVIPKAEYRKQAEDYLQELKKEHGEDAVIVTVHARRLEGECTARAQQRILECVNPRHHTDRTVTTDNLVDFCNVNYELIQKDLAAHGNDQQNTVVVLLTDGQRPDLDDTFPIVVSNSLSFIAQVWLMTISDIHYGSPMSSVDFGVTQWRQWATDENTSMNVRPTDCWVPPPYVKEEAEKFHQKMQAKTKDE